MLFGELLLDVLMVVDGGTAIYKLAAKIPTLLKMLRRLQQMAPAMRAAAKTSAKAEVAVGGTGSTAARLGADAKAAPATRAKSAAGSKGPEAREKPQPHEEPDGKGEQGLRVCTGRQTGRRHRRLQGAVRRRRARLRGQSWQFVYAMGQTMVTDNLGRREYYQFDRECRYTGKTDALGGAERFELDAFGNLSPAPMPPAAPSATNTTGAAA